MPNLHGPEQKRQFQEMVHSILNSSQATPIIFIISDTTTDSMTSITLFDNSFFENKLGMSIKRYLLFFLITRFFSDSFHLF